MPLQQLRNVNFGRNRANATGSTGVGYTVLDVSGSVVAPRTTAGVYQLTSGSGIYAAYVSFPDHFRGQILWDTGAAFSTASYAAEQYNVEENNPKVDDTLRVANTVSGTLNIVSGAVADVSGGMAGLSSTMTLLSSSVSQMSASVVQMSGSVATMATSVAQLSGTVAQLYHTQYGRWRITNNQMIFYKDDNVTEVVRFNLFDENGNPSMDAVFERVKV